MFLIQNGYRVNTGLKQGCLISPILFNLYINDLAIEMKQHNKNNYYKW